MVQKHFKLSDSAFKKQFVECTLDPADFSHEAHLRIAWIYINQYEIEKAEEEIQNQLLNYVDFVGARDKYHKTLTIAAIKVVYHFWLKSKSSNFQDFIIEFPQLNNKFKELLDSHYSFDIFSLDKAKTAYLEPDLMLFD